MTYREIERRAWRDRLPEVVDTPKPFKAEILTEAQLRAERKHNWLLMHEIEIEANQLKGLGYAASKVSPKAR